MASIFKRKKAKNEPYTIQYVDHLGKRKTVLGFTDKGLSENLASKLETESRLRRTGLIDPSLEKAQEQKLSPLESHLQSFRASINDNTAKYVNLVMNRIQRIVDAKNLSCLADITSESVLAALQALQKEPKFGHRTYNHYLQAFAMFCNWCVQTERLPRSPVATLKPLNADVDVRRKRRALTPDEFSKLVKSARASNISIQEYDGETRARIYTISYLTGLRRNEIGSLTPRSFTLTANPPTLTVEAGSSKHRKKDVLPLHPELVEQLPRWLEGLSPNAKLFPMLGVRKASVMVKKDLERVGIPYVTDDGTADFHAAGRHTHITELLRNGASLPEAKELARHSDIKMTLKYTHIGMDDQAKAVSRLKIPHNPTIGWAESALHGRCNSGGTGGQSQSLPENGSPRKKSRSAKKKIRDDIKSHPVSKKAKIGPAGFEPTTSTTPR